MTRQNETFNMFSSIWSERIPKGKFLYDEDTYRTKDGIALFTFGFVEVNNHIEIDILEQPSYGSRANDAHSTHRLDSERGGKKVCFGDPDYIHQGNAKKWAAEWAEATWKYIKTGVTF